MITQAIAFSQQQNAPSVAVLSLKILQNSFDIWQSFLPKIQIRYAVKCNNLPQILIKLHQLGTGFDCASPGEIDMAIAAGAAGSDIIFANPQIPEDWIKYAFKMNVNTFVFDSEEQLQRLVDSTPENLFGNFVLRFIPPDESQSHNKMGFKFGATKQQCISILNLATKLKQQKSNFQVIGLAFHVGSCCGSSSQYKDAILLAGELAKISMDMGMPMSLLDIGGGFTTETAKQHQFVNGFKLVSFQECAQVISDSLKLVGNNFKNLVVISEPGRFFAQDCITIVFKVQGRRIFYDDIDSSKINEVKYFCSEGVYGWFLRVIVDGIKPNLKFYRNQEQIQDQTTFLSQIFGPTCAGVDCLLKNEQLPMLQVGDYVACENYGQYSCTCRTNFNSIPETKVFVIE